MARKNVEMAQKIRDDCNTWENYWHDNKNGYNEFIQFIFGNQWLDEEARVFESYKKIPLTFNKIAPLANHMLGEQRQNTPNLEVVPDETVPVELAEIREALIKDLTIGSHTAPIFQTAFQSAICGGYGAWYVDMDYEDEHSFKTTIKIKEIPIPTRCFWDVSATTQCKTDGTHCGFRTRMSRKKFRAMYGKDIETSIPPTNIEEGSVFNDDESVTIYTYWKRDYRRDTLYQLTNGRIVNGKEYRALERIEIDDQKWLMDNGEPVAIEQKREIADYQVKKMIYAGDYELAIEDFPSKQLPMIFLDQNSFYNKEGTQVCRSFFKDTKDAQRYINYLATQSAYLVKIGRYDQYLIETGNARSNDTAQIWRDPSNVQGGLKFDPVQSGFTPQQQKPPELSQSLIQQYERAERDLKSCTGLYDSILGLPGNEVSGEAINARNKRTSFNTWVPYDNINRAIAITGEIINEMIPTVYPDERNIMVNLKDTGQTAVTLNKQMDEYGGMVQNDMTKGNFKIRLLPGPSFEGQKEEALKSMQLILQANPQLFAMIADLYVENLPLANNLELRNRLRTIVPPEIIEAGKSGKPLPPKPEQPNPEVMMKMQELKLMEKQLQMEQQKLQMEAQLKGEDIKVKWEELEVKKQQAAAELQEMELRYLAENHRADVDSELSQADHLIKLLTLGQKHHLESEKIRNIRHDTQ